MRQSEHAKRNLKNAQGAFTLRLSVPRKIDVALVNASVLSDYEAWIFIASLLANAVVGFFVAAVTNKDGLLATIGVVFSILCATAIKMAFYKRRQIRSGRRRLKL